MYCLAEETALKVFLVLNNNTRNRCDIAKDLGAGFYSARAQGKVSPCLATGSVFVGGGSLDT
jgi:hypothetical protein